MTEEKHKKDTFSALILAAGLSERMGHAKALLKYNDTELFISQIVNQLKKAGIENIVIVVNKSVYNSLKILKPELFNSCKIILNKQPENGRNSSIKLGLSEISTTYIIIHNVDNPFITIETIQNLLFGSADNEILIPCFKGKGGHPILISQKIVKNFMASEPKESFREFLQQFEIKRTEVSDNSVLYNITTPEDYKKLFHYNLSKKEQT